MVVNPSGTLLITCLFTLPVAPSADILMVKSGLAYMAASGLNPVPPAPRAGVAAA